MGAVCFDFVIDVTHQGTAYEEIARRIESAILNGGLSTGDRLPSTRALASQLKLARGTVKAAYALLAGKGFVESRAGAGTIITAHAKEWLERIVGDPKSRIAALADADVRDEPSPPLPFQLGLPAFDEFPRKIWSRLLVKRARMIGAESMHYPPPTGLPRLRQEIVNYLALARGVVCNSEQVLITGGYQDSLSMICDAMIGNGDRVALEDPGYMRARRILEAVGAEVVPISVDQEGMEVEELAKLTDPCRLAFVTPSHQFPMTVSLSRSRCDALLRWAEANGAYVVEDDYDGEFHYVGRPPRALKSADRNERVIYLGTFSKSLFPALRLGYLVTPPTLAKAFADVARRRGTARPPLEQFVVADFMKEGHFYRHLQAMRQVYRRRRDRLVKALYSSFGNQVSIAEKGGGIHLVVRFRGLTDGAAAARAALENGLFLLPLGACAVRLPADPETVLLSFTNVAETRAEALAQQLERVLAPFIA
ncbi:MocR-like pyridoxine biosynthesis transcription factor PdxR [Rhizorhapis suberifaciens]|uniref:GntR family transcriptional regulator/MocR family aminotransferase n=1 Tax=Rhizorhapis suberifaciens TaxID=13656 RepID=A0A840HT56_9SPHN|nr:PLP-dependent aminotransferase family protein [Rhizorhapis suberifaciens]MBB4640738.1 GntR family transcriptional regulator/MocR family aminotransferase [Rhizorhapis suberifaciens]